MKNLKRQVNSGFTLVELLVVISIIALLLSILMPSLNQARNQARMLVCSANNKQVGTLIATYRASNNNCVPMVGNRFSKTAGTSLLSVAFRDYIGNLQKLPDDLSPDKNWHFANNKVTKYNDKYLPDCFTCPFVRGKKAAGVNTKDLGIVTIGKSTFYNAAMGDGKYDSFQISGDAGRKTGYEDVRYGSKGMRYIAHPLGMPHGSLKYALLPWNADMIMDLISESEIKKTDRVVKYPTKWSGAELKRQRANGESDAVVAWCSAGEWYDWYSRIFNYKSHMKKKLGGTTALFADTHVEWVPGTQIGWN